MKDDPLTHYIPRRLNDNPKFLFWDWDVAIIFVLGAMVGIYCGMLKVGLIGGFGLAAGWSRLKSGKHPGIAIHVTYWFIGKPSLKEIPAGYIREMVG